MRLLQRISQASRSQLRSALSPKLLVIHKNDLMLATNIHLHTFADDTSLHSSKTLNIPVSLTELNFNRQAAAAFSIDHYRLGSKLSPNYTDISMHSVPQSFLL